MYKCNVDYFETINTEEKAYWLGFIYADGCIVKDLKSMRINLSPIDVEHLEKLKQCLQSNNPIRYKDDRRYVSLNISKTKIVTDLIDKGCHPAKSLNLMFPSESQVPKDMQKFFIRGYFDGDGCFSAKMRNIKNKPNPIFCGEINILGTYDMLINIKRIVPAQFKDIFEFGKIYKMRIQNKPEIYAFLSYIYDDANIYLNRKYQKYQDNKINFIDRRVYKINPVTTTAV